VSTLAQQIEQKVTGPVSLLLHIGAGGGALLGLAGRAQRAILVEPDPDRFRELQALAAGSDSVRLVHAAIAPVAGQAAFHKASLNRFGALSRPTGARSLYRGLKSAGEVQVPVTTVADLLGTEAVDGPAVIVIDAASAALVALQQVEALGLLKPSTILAVKVSELSLHEQGVERSRVEAWAAERGLRLTRVPGQDDPDIWTAWLDAQPGKDKTAPSEVPAASEVTITESELDDLRKQLEAAQAENAKLADRLDEKHKSADRAKSKAYRAQKRSETLEAKCKELTAQNKSLKEAGVDATRNLEALKAAEEQRQALETSLEQLKARHEEGEAQRKALSEQVQTLSRERSSAEQQLARLTSVEAKLRAQLEESETQRKELNEQLQASSRERANAEQQVARLTSAEAKLKSQLDQSEAQRAELREQLKSEARERSSAEQQLARLMEQFQEIQNELKSASQGQQEMRRQLDAKSAEAQRATTDLTARTRELEGARSELDSVRADLSLALRVQRLAQADLQDLQKRFGELEQEKISLEALLMQLMDRLYEASGQIDAVSWSETDKRPSERASTSEG
jgi:FkbM family methyltransferase